MSAKPHPLSPEDALRRAELIVMRDYQSFSTDEARRIIAGLLALLDGRGKK